METVEMLVTAMDCLFSAFNTLKIDFGNEFSPAATLKEKRRNVRHDSRFLELQ